MEEIGKALKIIFDKLSDFFNIFDLSFLISGLATSGVIFIWARQRDIFIDFEVKTTPMIILVVLICYIAGLISFAIGRWIRMIFMNFNWGRYSKDKYTNELNKKLNDIIQAHGLKNVSWVQDYLTTENRRIWRFYIRLWSLVRENVMFENSRSLLNRYWVMSATYDGLSFSALVALILVVDSTFGLIGDSLIARRLLGIIVILLLFIIFCACIREAKRYVEYQMEELIATIAASVH